MDTQQEQVQQVIDFSTIIPSMPKLENQEITTQEVGNRVETKDPTFGMFKKEEAPETPVNEFIIVDGEKVEVNLDEIIGNHPDGTPIKLRDTDNPKSYKFFQARDSRKDKRLKELEDKLNVVQQPQVQPEQKLEPPKRPEFPKRPKDFDPTESVTNPDSPSYQYERMKEDYYAQRDTYDKYKEDELFSFKGQIEAKEQAQLKSQQELAYQSQMLGQISQIGGVDQNEAKEIWDTYTTPKDNESFLKELVEFHHFKKGKATPQTQKTIDNFNRNGQRQSQFIAPPGVIGSQSAPENPTLGDELLKITKQYRM